MFPIVHALEPVLSLSERKRADGLARELRRDHDDLIVPEALRPLVVSELSSAPSVHLDDQSAISSVGNAESSFLQERARLRAGAGDYVVAARPPTPGYEPYCEHQLGLGNVVWLTAGTEGEGDPRRLASRAIQDRSTRRKLVQAFRHERLHYVHPYMGHRDVWVLAQELRLASRRPVKVIAPFPGLTRWVNDKITFAETVVRLFSERLVPETHAASNLAVLAEEVHALAEEGRPVVIKLPDSASGAGNLVLEAQDYAERPLAEIREAMKALLSEIPWRGEKHLLVGRWDQEAFAAPSVQLWIPPSAGGGPIVEGIFEQRFESVGYRFIGSRRAELPRFLIDEIAKRSALLALVFQHLGYVGRCSFDLILAGKSPGACRIEFIEANGRWGGTSSPMALVHRLLRDTGERPYVERALVVPGLEKVTFMTLLDAFQERLYDARTREGSLVFYNPDSMRARSSVHVVAFAETAAGASATLETFVRERSFALARAAKSTDQ